MSGPEVTALAVGEMEERGLTEERGLGAQASLSEDPSFTNSARQPVFILAAGRTAIAPAHGPLSKFELHDLVAENWKALSNSIRTHTPAFSVRDIQAVFLGNGLAAGGNPARLCALAAGFDYSIPGLTVDTQCCGGLDALGLATSRIATGEHECVLVGGAESASNAPARARRLKDGSLAFYSEAQFAPDDNPSMAQAARGLANGMDLHSLYRYAIDSHERAMTAAHPDLLTQYEAAASAGVDPHEQQAALDSKSTLGRDSHPRPLSMALCERGESNPIHNPATMAPLADGSCLLVLASQRKVGELKAKPMAEVLGYRSVGADPTQPALAVNQLLPWLESVLKRHLSMVAHSTDKDPIRATKPIQVIQTIAVELMESFSAQAILNRRTLAEWAEKLLQKSAGNVFDINPHGGLLALGHPIGASGAVLAARLAHRLAPGQLGVAIIPAAGGLASALLLKGV